MPYITFDKRSSRKLEQHDINIHSGKSLPADVGFYLNNIKVDGEVVAVKYLGAWQMVDNGYINWTTAIPPSKNSVTFEELR